MYGFKDKAHAEAKALELAKRYKGNLYRVEIHDHSRRTWGITEWTTYLEDGSRKCNGFMWFNPTQAPND